MSHSTPTADALRFLDEDDRVRVVWPLKNGRPAHVLSREERARGGRVRAAKARERKASLKHERRSSARLVEAAQRLGEMLRSDDLRTAMWAEDVLTRYILGERLVRRQSRSRRGIRSERQRPGNQEGRTQ